MASTYTPIATYTVSSAQSSYTFSSISSAYTDLVIVVAPKYSTSAATRININGDTGNNYSQTFLYGNGSSAGSFRVTNSVFVANYFNNGSGDTPMQILNFMNYSNGSMYKTVLVRNANSAAGTDAAVNLWRNTAAITSIELSATTGNFATGSTFTLYGIKAA